MREAAIALVETAYDVDHDLETWIARVANAVARVDESGIVVHLWRLGARPFATHFAPCGLARFDPATFQALEPAVYDMAPVERVAGMVGINARIDAGHGLLIWLAGTAHDTPVWTRLAPQLGAALHLHERLHAAPARIDRSRGRLERVDPDEAVELWHALARGEWSLVDRQDTDGRRLVVAHRRGHSAATGVLSPREAEVAALLAEGHSDKLIAYELGLAPSTVANVLSRACEKLGATSSIELVQLVRGKRRRLRGQ